MIARAELDYRARVDPYKPPADGLQEQPQVQVDSGIKQRHGCVTAWLILMIVANSATIFSTLALSDEIKRALPNMPDWGGPVLILCGVINVVCAVMLFKWKRIGFFGFVITSLIAAAVNVVAGVDAIQTLMGMVGVLILFGILQIGSPKSAWSQME